jgi:hypothetical protein
MSEQNNNLADENHNLVEQQYVCELHFMNMCRTITMPSSAVCACSFELLAGPRGPFSGTSARAACERAFFAVGVGLGADESTSDSCSLSRAVWPPSSSASSIVSGVFSASALFLRVPESLGDVGVSFCFPTLVFLDGDAAVSSRLLSFAGEAASLPWPTLPDFAADDLGTDWSAVDARCIVIFACLASLFSFAGMFV